MSAFLENIEPFRGTGEKNEKNQSLEEFLDVYNADKYPKPSVTADSLIFSYRKDDSDILNSLKILMVKRRNHPSIGYWALPGGFANMDEDLDETARRELLEETSLENVPMTQLYTCGEYARDPRDRVVTAIYIALVQEGIYKEQAGDDAKDAKWCDVIVKKGPDSYIEENGQKVKKQLYYLSLSCKDIDEPLSATVAEYENVESILREKKYEVESCENIAFDHSRSIIMGYCYIREKCSNMPK